jgi:hypothetical protein
LARGGTLSAIEARAGWHSYINDGDYSGLQQELLVSALLEAQRHEFNALLPEGCEWQPHTSEIVGPVGTDMRHVDDDLMLVACERVVASIEVIEARTLIK